MRFVGLAIYALGLLVVTFLLDLNSGPVVGPFILYLAPSVLAGALLGRLAALGPGVIVAVLFALYAGRVDLDLFGDALWGVGAIFLALYELLAVGVGILLRRRWRSGRWTIRD